MTVSKDPAGDFSTNPPVPEMVHLLAYQVKERWWSFETSLPPLGPVYSASEKRQREAHLSACLNELSLELKQHPPSVAQPSSEQQASLERLTALATRLARDAFNLDERHVSALRSYGFEEVTQEFIRQARRFDPGLSQADIFQACRNAWSMNFFQLLFGLPLEVTPALLAYSLLYPYSDNYLDDPQVPLPAKISFGLRFRQKLEGKPIQPVVSLEQKIFDLVSMIESQFGRSRFPQVYDSLLAIYEAQANSLQMQRPGASPYEVDVLGLGIEKGGTSVLADGYLVAGSLTAEQMEFMFSYGAFTQLLDDLEDVGQDLRSGIQTVFSQTASHWPLDAITNRTIRFGQHFLELLDGFTQPRLEPLIEAMRMSLAPLMIDAASQAGHFYTRPYLAQIEPHYPFRFSYIRQTRKTLQRRKLTFESLIGLVA